MAKKAEKDALAIEAAAKDLEHTSKKMEQKFSTQALTSTPAPTPAPVTEEDLSGAMTRLEAKAEMQAKHEEEMFGAIENDLAKMTSDMEDRLPKKGDKLLLSMTRWGENEGAHA